VIRIALGQSELGKFFPERLGAPIQKHGWGCRQPPTGGLEGGVSPPFGGVWGGIPPKGGVGGCRRGSPAVLSSYQPQPFFQVPT
jgi:hypothetical protein